MIKTGILGAETPDAGELMRILVNHTDVDIIAPVSPMLRNTPIAAHHHGLTGETEINFCDTFDPAKLDFLVVPQGVPLPADLPADLRIVDMNRSGACTEGFVLGLSEVNRKELVRGATRAYIPAPIAVVATIALYPLAAAGLLPPKVKINATVPATLHNPGDAAGIVSALKVIGLEAPEIELNIEEGEADRAVTISFSIPSHIDREQAENIFEEIYDDHRFTFIVPPPVRSADVEGTQKCLIAFTSDDDDERLTVNAIADGHLRGGAGDVVHVMNLLFGLYEKTGLALKASAY